MCTNATNHSLPVIVASSLNAGRAALRAGVFFSILVHGIVVGGVLWSEQAELVPLSAQGDKGTVVFLVAGQGKSGANRLSEGASVSRVGEDHGQFSEPSHQGTQQAMPAEVSTKKQETKESLISPVRTTRSSSVRHENMAKRQPLPERNRGNVEPAVRQESKIRSPERPSALSARTLSQSSTLERAGGADSQGQAEERREGADGQLNGMQEGQASGIGTSQGSGVGEAVHARFGMDVGPSFIRFTPPVYPASARRRGISGLVLLRVLISAQGRAERIEVVSSVDDSLSRSACTAVRNAVFAPYKPSGKALACWAELPIRFQLERMD